MASAASLYLSTLPRAASFASLAGPQSCGRSGQVGVGQGVCHSDIAQEHLAIHVDEQVGYGTAGRRQATLLTLRPLTAAALVGMFDCDRAPTTA